MPTGVVGATLPSGSLKLSAAAFRPCRLFPKISHCLTWFPVRGPKKKQGNSKSHTRFHLFARHPPRRSPSLPSEEALPFLFGFCTLVEPSGETPAEFTALERPETKKRGPVDLLWEFWSVSDTSEREVQRDGATPVSLHGLYARLDARAFRREVWGEDSG